MRVGEAEGDSEGDGRRTLANGWESRLWRLEDKHLREGSSVRQFGRPCPLRICHRRRRITKSYEHVKSYSFDWIMGLIVQIVNLVLVRVLQLESLRVSALHLAISPSTRASTTALSP